MQAFLMKLIASTAMQPWRLHFAAAGFALLAAGVDVSWLVSSSVIGVVKTHGYFVGMFSTFVW